MNECNKDNSIGYTKLLISMSILGGILGWVVQGVSDGFIFWALPLFCLVSAAVTLNGDNIIESLVILLLIGGLFIVAWRFDLVITKYGVGTVLGIYVSMCVAKIGFSFAKSGVFWNKNFG